MWYPSKSLPPRPRPESIRIQDLLKRQQKKAADIKHKHPTERTDDDKAQLTEEDIDKLKARVDSIANLTAGGPLPKNPIDNEIILHDDHLPHLGDPEKARKFTLVYQWIVLNIQAYVAAINEAVEEQGEAKYDKAVERYHKFIERVYARSTKTDEHHGDNAGAGELLAWIDVEPTYADTVITDVRVIVKWVGGTHSSGMGVHA